MYVPLLLEFWFWTLTSSDVVSGWRPPTSGPAGSVSAVCPRHPPSGRKRDSPPDPDLTPDSPLQSHLHKHTDDNSLFTFNWLALMDSRTAHSVKHMQHKWDPKNSSYRVKPVDLAEDLLLAGLYFVPLSNSSASMTLFVCVFVNELPEVINSEDRIQAQVWPYMWFFRKTSRETHACPRILSASKWACVSVSVCTSACCYWVSLAGRLLALDQQPEATSHHLLKLWTSRRSDWRSTGTTGSTQKPQTLANTWAGVTVTIPLHQKLTFRQRATKSIG